MGRGIATLGLVAIVSCGEVRPDADPSGTGVESVGTGEVTHTDGEDASADVRFDVANTLPPEVPFFLAEPPPPPVSGGTLLASKDGALVFASDPDRDAVFVVDTEALELVHEVALPAGSEPGRLVQDSTGLLHVALRRSGEVVTIDPMAGEVVATRAVCGNPRGLASDQADGSLWVACAEGTLVRIGADDSVEHMDIGVELRDVVDVGPPLRVSTFRTPQVLTLSSDGVVIESQAPGPIRLGDEEAVPNTARRSFAGTSGGWVMLHQLALRGPLSVEAPSGYGGACLPAQSSAVAWWDEAQGAAASMWLEALAPAFDLAVSGDGKRVAIVGFAEGGPAVVFRTLGVQATVAGGCSTSGAFSIDGDPTAVAFGSNDRAWVQTREPATLVVFDSVTYDELATVPLSATSVRDSGHDLFHHPTAALVACVSCHPEGRDDGLVWSFEDIGERRTQALHVGLEGTEPFHWNGDMPNILAIDDEVRGHRMGGDLLPDEFGLALQRWLFALPRDTPPPTDPDAVARGAQIYFDVGCFACHGDPEAAQSLTVSLPGIDQPLQVPTLRGVAFRPPYMHDGRSPDLDAAITDMLAVSTPGGPLSDDATADLRAYLRSL